MNTRKEKAPVQTKASVKKTTVDKAKDLEPKKGAKGGAGFGPRI